MRLIKRFSGMGVVLLLGWAWCTGTWAETPTQPKAPSVKRMDGGNPKHDPTPPPPITVGRLVILNLHHPVSVPLGETFDVAVAAADSLGVQAIELHFEEDVVYLPVEPAQSVVVTAQLIAEATGRRPLDAIAIGIDGLRGTATTELVDVGDDSPDKYARPGVSPEEFRLRLAEWERLHLDPLELWARDEIYLRRGTTKAKTVRTQVIAALDEHFDRVETRVTRIGRPVFLQNWWEAWMKANRRERFDWDAHCDPDVVGVDPAGEVLQCWLDLNPRVRQRLTWFELNEFGDKTYSLYDQWPHALRGRLYQLFWEYYFWLAGRLGTFPGLQLPDIAPNQLQLQDRQYAATQLSRHDALELYLHTIAHSLAVEIGGFVPWSVRAYHDDDLDRLFSVDTLLGGGLFLVEATNLWDRTEFIGYWGRELLPTPPTKIFEYLVNHNLLRPTHYHTIARMMKWGRENALHYSGGKTALDAQKNWQYRGGSPVARMLDLTVRQDLSNADPKAWMRGCHGVAAFMQIVLRAANIPVALAFTGNSHRVPVFYSIGMTMSHGDDLYDVLFNIPSVDPDYLPPGNVLIPNWQWDQWFLQTDPQTAAENVGRQTEEIALRILPNKLMNLFCDDTRAFVSHANGAVYNNFKPIWTVAELELMGLWHRLAQKEQAYDFCPDLVFNFP